MPTRLKIVTTGLVAQYPLGGVTWDYLQYVTGLASLGHDVYYIEDTDQWPYSPAKDGICGNPYNNVNYLAKVMARFGLQEKWAYQFPWQEQWFGLSDERRKEVIETADLVINVSGTLAHPEKYRSVPRMAYIDTDPVFTQVKLARGQHDFRRNIDVHDVFFSFGERLSASPVPDTEHSWIPTRQPIVLGEWEHTSTQARNVFTTVMNWTSYNPLKFDGQVFGQKDLELRRFLDLPSMVAPTPLELAVSSGKTRRTPRELLSHRGWRLVDPLVVGDDIDSYRRYVQTSKAEWSVAKHGYVVGRSGWFSCRSACYLAAGRPVVVQDTGFRSVLPVGRGIVPFSSIEEAVEGIREVESNYDSHSSAAREIAREYFDASKVLSSLVDVAMNSAHTSSTELLP